VGRVSNSRRRQIDNSGAPVKNKENVMTLGPGGPMVFQGVWFLEKFASNSIEKPVVMMISFF
jgi:catalase